jgi:hypothetical protein
VEEWRKNTLGTSSPKDGCFIKLDIKKGKWKSMGRRKVDNRGDGR